ncbi:hypothetical protein Slin15195_G060400 [Septoria linicola]|uniref:Xylanolytic transcriptional activator regulatory domain-containing protein n=1 Tax=Septoria linicola TaxID=215465 RepID=A0A9Q9AY23_9PEZI|nr:hypothetical protein Slin14017_G076240 [Septoria linicola]USW52721.1 hypothetical protein Slin15195_G060400 [Septoria linicola]
MSTHQTDASALLLSTVSGRARRQGIVAVAACETCRQRKVKATKRKLGTYDGTSLYEELFQYLSTVDAQQASLIYQRIRSGEDVQKILAHIRAGDLNSQLDLRPETQYRYKFPYDKSMPWELLARNPYLDSLIYETGSLGLDGHESQHMVSKTYLPRVAYLRPLHAAHFVDPLIDNAKPSTWTAVCDDDVLMRRLLRNLFMTEFYFMAALQKDYFLEDMISHQGGLCSSLLVNAVMAYACVCDPAVPHREEYWNPGSLTYQFLMEAKRLWELESTTPTIANVQAGILLNGISNWSGLDEIGQTYRATSIKLANHLGLYDGPIKASSERSRQCGIYTAWALFCWDSLLAFSLQQPPFLHRPPYDPLPSSTANKDWYVRFLLQYPGQEGVIDAQFAVIFEHQARFRVIMASYCSAAYGDTAAFKVSIGDAYLYRAHLLEWFGSLPASLRPENIVLPTQLQLHMCYHHLMVTIFEPFIAVQHNDEPKPNAITYEANRYYATLFRLYYLRHGHENMDIRIIISLIFAGTECLEAIQQSSQSSDLESLRSTLVLCAKGLYDQRRNNYLAHALNSALRTGMRPEEVALLKQIPDLRDDEESVRLRQVTKSKWLSTVIRDPELLSGNGRVDPAS